MELIVVEGLLVMAAGRAYASSRAPALARPRRGSADLPDLDAPERTAPEPPVAAAPPPAPDRWVFPASVGLVAVVGGIVARAAVALI